MGDEGVTACRKGERFARAMVMMQARAIDREVGRVGKNVDS